MSKSKQANQAQNKDVQRKRKVKKPQPLQPTPVSRQAYLEPVADPQQLTTAPQSVNRPADILALQRTVGNQAVTRLLVAQRGGPVRNPHKQQQDSTQAIIQRAMKPAWVKVPRLQLFDYDDSGSKKKVRNRRIDSLKMNEKVKAEDNPEYENEAGKKKYTHVTVPKDGVVLKAGLRFKGPTKSRAGGWDSIEAISDLTGAGSDAADLHAGATDRGDSLRITEGDYRVDIPEPEDGGSRPQDWQDASTSRDRADIASGALGGVADILSLAATIRNWKEAKKSEKAGVGVDTLATTASLTANVTKTVDSGAKVNTTSHSGIGASDMAANVTGNIADFAGLIAKVKDIFFTFKEAWDVWHKESASRGDKGRAAFGVGITILKTVKDAVATARNLLFTLENAWHAGLSAAVPGLGIAITALQLCLNAYDAIKADLARERMRRQKMELSKKLAKKWGFGEEIPDWWIHEKKKEIRAQRGVIKDDSPHKEDLDKVLNKQLGRIEDYEIVRELKTINRKRVNRQIINITSGFMNIAGHVATLSGAGAGVGVGFKAAGSATHLGAKAARTIKQSGRDLAARGGALGKVFNAGKSSANKLANREWIANRIYDRTIDIAERLKNDEKVLLEEWERLKLYIRGAGLSFKSWYVAWQTDPDTGHKMLMDGLAKRE